MKNKVIKKVMGTTAVIMISTALLAGCGQEYAADTGSTGSNIVDTVDGSGIGTDSEIEAEIETDTETEIEIETDTETDSTTENQTARQVTELEVRFGDNGEPFMMKLSDNETAAAIARYVGTSEWRLPIYERDSDADYDVMQYYDVSSRYDIPSNPETVTSEKAGEVYYSHPNRIVLFYHDAEITGEYTKIGTFDATEEFVTAVEENPVLEGWGNKIVQIAQP